MIHVRRDIIATRKPGRAAVGCSDEGILVSRNHRTSADPSSVYVTKTNPLRIKGVDGRSGAGNAHRHAVRLPRGTPIGGFVINDKTLGRVLLQRAVTDLPRWPG